MIQPSLLGSTNSNFKENPQVSSVSKKDEKEEVEKKITKWIWTIIHTEMFMTLQYAHFHSVCIFSVNRHIFIQ